MIGLDSNVLVRYLAQDEPAQAAKAAAIIERRLSPSEPGYVSLVTMVETVWVLQRAYRLKGPQLTAAIEAMLQSEVLQIQNEQQVFTAMMAVKDGVASFADALIAALGTAAGCSYTVTFDREAARLPAFQLLE
jgi:predicted nucleic-acid-binding protein